MPLLLGGFAFLALLLAAVGVYGVIAYVVEQRTHEIGVRIALGAQGSDVVRMLLAQGMGQIAIGVILGLTGAWILTRLMRSLLFGVNFTDPLILGASLLLVLIVALAAAGVPIYRALQIDPASTLKSE